MLVLANTAVVDFLDALRTSFLDGLVDVHLFQNDFQPDGSTVLGDFTEANFGGYTPEAGQPFDPVQLRGPMTASTKMGSASFAADGGAPSNLVYGAYATIPGPELFFSTRFPNAPITMGSVGDSIAVHLVFQLSPIP
jgi:hypothetical protein